ncbi:hypothetical protein AN189_15170 [Loktanella sp. 3ANDIMAR09]|uniref:YceI family protein n=1 Tax=Loktanella sp. 3ANDIMAR09 TaxID=1225657 RepID=UPI0006F43980|nr:YceI family protein [Loktanella sp. 3ANDIMAR09]KQI67523.1 hypothetical protein AN189_15170 [Loktanella sp. 3ANDIMAR09]
MKTPIATLVGALAFANTVSAEPARFELDPAHTTIAFLVDHVGYAATLGLFAEVSGGFTYDTETQELSDLEVTVRTQSVETLNDARDEHVRSGDFLAVADHPDMVFTADGGVPSNATSGTVTGDLTLLGQTHPLTLDVTLNKAADYPFGHGRFTLGISARGSLQRSQWGMVYGVDNGLVGDTVTLIIETEAMRAAD